MRIHGWHLVLAALAAGAADAKDVAGAKLFSEVCDTVQARFFDASFVKDSLPGLRREFSPRFAATMPEAEFRSGIALFLKRLHASHTYLLDSTQQEYYQLLSIFEPLPQVQRLSGGKPIVYPSVGIVLQSVQGRFFVASVFPGSPAATAGVLSGDEIVSADGKPLRAGGKAVPVPSRDSLPIEVRRAEGRPAMLLVLHPKSTAPSDEFLAAQEGSVRIDTIGGRRIGYMHLYSYAGSRFHDALVEALLWGPLKDVDGVVIDLRFGLGGADPSYLNLFNKSVPTLRSRSQDGTENVYDSQWRKPVVFLVDRTSRSGKEILAFGARKYKLALVVGDTTAGEVLAGSPFLLSDGDLLFLAVNDARVDGERLEGHGVPPDVYIPWDVRFMQGRDPRITKAQELLAKRIVEGQLRGAMDSPGTASPTR